MLTYSNMHGAESDLETETNKILCDFQMQTDHSIPVRSDLVLINMKKRNNHFADFTLPEKA